MAPPAVGLDLDVAVIDSLVGKLVQTSALNADEA